MISGWSACNPTTIRAPGKHSATAAATRSVPFLNLPSVRMTPTLFSLAASATAGESVATATASISSADIAWATACMKRGIPVSFSSTFPSSRLDSTRAGTTQAVSALPQSASGDFQNTGIQPASFPYGQPSPSTERTNARSRELMNPAILPSAVPGPNGGSCSPS